MDQSLRYHGHQVGHVSTGTGIYDRLGAKRNESTTAKARTPRKTKGGPPAPSPETSRKKIRRAGGDR